MATTSPPVLAPATDDDLAARALTGDDAPVTDLLARYRPFVRAKARSYFLVGGDREDVVQEGMIGLYKAVRDYQVDRDCGFRAFADLCVTRQIITAVKTATRHKHQPLNGYVSLHLPAHGSDDGDHELIEEVVGAEADPAEAVVSTAELAALGDYVDETLSDLETDVLQRYVAGQTYAEIAEQLDRHVKSIDNALQRIKRKLEGYLADRSVETA